MTLEEEIKQMKPFKNPHEKAIVNLIFTNNWMHVTRLGLFKKHGVSPEQYNVLRILRGQAGKPISINGVIDRMLDKMSNASRLVDKLVVSGYAIRTENAKDRRVCDVVISPKGAEKLKKMDADLAKMHSNIGELTDEDAEKLNELLDKLRITKK